MSFICFSLGILTQKRTLWNLFYSSKYENKPQKKHTLAKLQKFGRKQKGSRLILVFIVLGIYNFVQNLFDAFFF